MLTPAQPFVPRLHYDLDNLPPVEHQGEVSYGPPDFIGLGAQKAGTSWWFDLLAEHPAVYFPKGAFKETHFFDSLDLSEPADISAYQTLFGRPVGTVTGEWTPSYLPNPDLLPLIQKAAPTAKILVMLRDPIERYASGVAHSGRAWGMLNDGWLRLHYRYGLYGAQLEQLFDYYPSEQVLVLQYERCVIGTAAQLLKTQRFLGLDECLPDGLDRQVNVAADGSKFFLSDQVRQLLRKSYQDDVAKLLSQTSEIDTSLWQNFADL